MIYDLSERSIDDEKLLKKLSLTSKLSIEKSMKELINNFIIESNIVLKVKGLYEKNEIFQKIIYSKKSEER